MTFLPFPNEIVFLVMAVLNFGAIGWLALTDRFDHLRKLFLCFILAGMLFSRSTNIYCWKSS